MSTLSSRLSTALQKIASHQPRLIASPVHAPPKRASVAIIVRIRPSSDTPPSPQLPSASITSDIQSPSTILQGVEAPDLDVSTSSSSSNDSGSTQSRIKEFFDQDWVVQGMPELLYIKRATRATDRWSAHVAFPGGRQDPDDENAQFTALRETFEEVGIDLVEPSYIPIGQLDDREITTSLGKRLLMILSPFVYLHTGKQAPVPELQTSEVASAHWIPISWLHSPQVRWGEVSIDLGSRLAPRSWMLRNCLRFLIGSMHFKCVLLHNEPISATDDDVSKEVDDPSYEAPLPDLRLWGLTLAMTLDLISQISPLTYSPGSPTETLPVRHPSPATYPFLEPLPPTQSAAIGSAAIDAPAAIPAVATRPKHARTGSSIWRTVLPKEAVQRAPSMASVFPRFEGIDLYFWLWIFSFRYRRTLRNWESSTQSTADRRVNWAGMALSSFYAALRRALVVAIFLRASVLVGGTATLAAWAFKHGKRQQIRQ